MIDREWEAKRYDRLMKEAMERQDRLDEVATGPWSTRIPAAIAKAEKRLRELGEIHGHTMTLTEVQLAKALWEDLGDGECVGEGIASHCDQGGCFGLSAEDEPALRAFTEKVEALP